MMKETRSLGLHYKFMHTADQQCMLLGVEQLVSRDSPDGGRLLAIDQKDNVC